MADHNDVFNRADALIRPEGSTPGVRPEGERASPPEGRLRADSSPLGGRAEGVNTSGPAPIAGRSRRSFIAAPKEPPVLATPLMPKLEEIVFAPAEPAEDDDLPVLTEIVAPEAAVSEASTDRFDETLLSILAADLAHSIETRLGIELPSLIEATLDSFQQDLRRGIIAATEAALKDFLARRQQLRLPLDEPNRDV